MKREELMKFAPIPKRSHDLLMAAAHSVEEEKSVKKKIWVVALVAALILMLAAGAVALVLSNFERVAELEATQGYFDTWPAKERAELVQMLLEEGLIQRDERVERLLAGGMTEEETEKLATQIVTEGLGLREDVVTFISVLEKVKGPMGHWSPEDKAWYTDVLRKNGILGADSEHAPQPIWPADSGIAQEEAVRIAFDAIAEAYRFSAEELATYKAAAEFYAIPGNEAEAKWMITFFPPKPDGGFEAYSGYCAVIDPKTGEVVADPDAGVDTPAQRVANMEITPEQLRERSALYHEKGHHFYWSHEERALYLPDRFSMPAPDAIPEAEAIRIALEAVQHHERTVWEELEGYKTIALFPSPDPESGRLVWSIVLVDQEGTDGTIYGYIDVMLDAKSGEVANIYGWGDAFPFPEEANQS